MRTRTHTLLLALAASLLLAATALAGGPTLLETGTTHHIELTVPSQNLDVIAGHITTTTTTNLGLTMATEPATHGWVLITPDTTPQPQSGTLEVTEERSFQDPNGGTWTTLEVTIDETTAWIAHVDEPRNDPTLQASYNFAAIIDHNQVPNGADLTATYHDTLPFDILEP